MFFTPFQYSGDGRGTDLRTSCTNPKPVQNKWQHPFFPPNSAVSSIQGRLRHTQSCFFPPCPRAGAELGSARIFWGCILLMGWKTGATWPGNSQEFSEPTGGTRSHAGLCPQGRIIGGWGRKWQVQPVRSITRYWKKLGWEILSEFRTWCLSRRERVLKVGGGNKSM